MLPLTGISWVKLPLWIAEPEGQKLDEVLAFAERLSSRGVELIGMLSDPPSNVRAHFGADSVPQTADIFTADSTIWYPSLEPVLTRLALQVRWWQLGSDSDTSFVGYPRLNEVIAGIKKTFEQCGQEVHLGLPWQIFRQSPPGAKGAWDFVSLIGSPQLTADELAGYLPAVDRTARRWVSLQPLDRTAYRPEVRIIDLVQRLLAAKIAGAEAIFHRAAGWIRPAACFTRTAAPPSCCFPGGPRPWPWPTRNTWAACSWRPAATTTCSRAATMW